MVTVVTIFGYIVLANFVASGVMMAIGN